MAWNLRNTVSMPGSRTGPVVASHAGWTFTRGEFEALSKQDAHGVFSPDQLIALMNSIIQSGDQYTKYGSEVRTYCVLMTRYFYDLYVECKGLVSPDDILSYYRMASSLYDKYEDIRGYIWQTALARSQAVGAENSIMTVNDSYELVVNPEKVTAAAEAEEKKNEQVKMMLYAGGGFAALLCILALIKRK